MHHKNHDDSKLAKINALSAEVFEDTKDVQRIQKGLSQQTTKEDSDDEADETVDLKANKKLALELEKKEQKEAKNNKMKAIELEKEEEGLTESSTDEAGSSGRITKILKMLEEEIVARSNKDSDPPVE